MTFVNVDRGRAEALALAKELEGLSQSREGSEDGIEGPGYAIDQDHQPSICTRN